MKPAAKAKKAKPKKKAASKAAAAERAEKIREEAAARRDLRPGQIIGGEDGWHYYSAPPDEPGRSRTEARLRDLGYEPAPGVKMVGVHRGLIWRVPQEIADDLNAAKAERLAVISNSPRERRR